MSPTSTHKVLRVGTRRSALAKSQTQWVIDRLTQVHPRLKIEIVEVVTTGDKILDSSLERLPGKGVFVKEIEEKLLANDIDLAVHSMKDLPTEFPNGLMIGAVPERVDPRDIFVTRHNKLLVEMPERARIGTGSFRRKIQLLNFRPDFEVTNIRGNIDTRLEKSESDDFDGIILAAAGLTRMGWQARIQEYLSCEVMIPAAGQGALGIEVREHDHETLNLVAALNEPETEQAVKAERRFLEKMGGGCQTPMGAFCRVRDGKVVFHGFHAEEDGSNFCKEKIEGDLKDAVAIADQLVEHFI